MEDTGLRIPPPIFYLTVLLIGLLLHYYYPIAFLSNVLKYSIGTTLIVVSFSIIPFVLIQYKKLNTPFDVSKSARALITNGPNRYSRNPGYLSLTILYLGIGFILNNIWILGLSIPLILGIDLYIIRKEESNLESVFGKEFLEYKTAVRRWI